MSDRLVKWKLNGQPVESSTRLSVLQACREQGIEIPSLCEGGETGHSPSCMVCFVREEKRGLISSCSVKVEEGFSVITEEDSISDAVKAGGTMLLNEHGGDCLSSCSLACRAGLDSSYMSRFIRAGDYEKAARYALRKLVFPELLSKVCEAACKKACRRNRIDDSVEIPMLHGSDLMTHYNGSFKPGVKRIDHPGALVSGSSPETWAAAHFLNLRGYNVTIACRDDRDFLWELKNFRDAYARDKERLEASGLVFINNLPDDLKNYEYILKGEISGEIDDPSAEIVEEFPEEKSLLKRIISGRDLVHELIERPHKMKKQISVIRSFSERERHLFLKQFPTPPRMNSLIDQAKSCLLCRCASEAHCSLKKLAERTGFRQQSGAFLRHLDEPDVWGELVYEFAKCINCRLCVKKSREDDSIPALGIAFKGLETRIIHLGDSPFSRKNAQILVKTCPTGALRLRYAFEV